MLYSVSVFQAAKTDTCVNYNEKIAYKTNKKRKSFPSFSVISANTKHIEADGNATNKLPLKMVLKKKELQPTFVNKYHLMFPIVPT